MDIQAEINALLAAYEAQRGGWKGALPNLSPDLLSYIKTLPYATTQAGNPDSTDPGGGYGAAPTRGDGLFSQQGVWASNPNASPDAQSSIFDPSLVNWGQTAIQFGPFNDENNAAYYGADGKFQNYYTMEDASSWKDFIRGMAMIVGPMVGGYFAGADGAAAGAAGEVGGSGTAATGGASGAYGAGGQMLLPTTAEVAAGMAPATVQGAMPALTNTLAAAGYGTAGASAGSTGLDAFRQGELANYSTNGSMPSSAATTAGNMTPYDRFAEGAKQAVGTGAGSDPGSLGNTVGNALTPSTTSTAATGANAATNLLGGNGSTLGSLLGAYLGYQDGKDKENTDKREPWAPLQPYLKGLASEGADLYGQYKADPYTPAQQAGYSNLGNVLDYINGNAGDLLSGFNATATGKNQFVRGQRNQLIGSSHNPATSPVAWSPATYGNFGTRRG